MRLVGSARRDMKRRPCHRPQVVGLAPAAACRLCNVQYVEAQAKGLPACTICGCHVAKPQLPAQAPAVGMPSVSLLACLEKWAQAGQGAGQARA